MPPAIQVRDFQTVDLSSGPVLFATYSPISSSATTQPHDVTQLVRNLQLTRSCSDLVIKGGIHTAIGDPFPNIAKVFKVWFANRPCEAYEDHTQVTLRQDARIIAASYGPPAESYYCVYEKMAALQSSGDFLIKGGIHTKIGDPRYGVAKQLRIWYE